MSACIPLSANSSQPLYEQLMQHLRAAIVTGEYEEGSKLPSEVDLCARYGVSRITARRAVSELVNEGLLERKQGKGTFVAPKKMSVRVMSLDGFAGLTRSREDARVRIVRKAERSANAKEARMLEITEGASIYELARVLELDGVPVSYDRSMYSVERFPNLLGMVDETVSTYDLMTNHYNHPNYRAEKEIVITAARPEEAEYLNCPNGDLLYLITKTMYDEDNVPNHISFYVVRAYMVKLSLSYTR